VTKSSRRPDLTTPSTIWTCAVDFVIERGSDLIGIEVKAASRPGYAAASHLRTFRDECGDAGRGCLLLQTGDHVEWLAPRILAAPWWRVLRAGSAPPRAGWSPPDWRRYG